MRTVWRVLLFAALAAAYGQSQVSGPSAPPFSLRIQQAGNVQIVADGATVAMPADGVGLPSTVSIVVTYTNTAQAAINSVALSGATDFSLVNSPSAPPTLTPGSATAAYAVQYLPTTSKAQAGKLAFTYTETTATATVRGTFTLNFTGTAPEFAYTYTPQPNGNTTLLNSGDTITLPPTPVLTQAATQISITNKGSGAGVVNGITYKGAPDFVLAGLPFPPATVPPGASLQFQVLFTPSNLPAVAGTVVVSFVAGRTLTFNLTGSGQGAIFSYEVLRPYGTSAVNPGDIIGVPDAALNATSTLTFRVRNTGNIDGLIQAISVSGAGYSLTQLPFLPDDLLAGSTVSFTINFTPTQAGKAPGKLHVDGDSFDLAATGLGSVLTYSYVAATSTFPLQSSGAIVFAPVAVGQSSTVHVIVANTGTADASINSISASGPAAAVFSVANAPKLPAAIAAGSQIAFDVTFAPTTLSTVNGTLRIDSQSFTLTGIGNSPAALPTYSISGASGTVSPLSQPAVGLSLAAPYPMDLTGTLNLAFNSAVFANDPSVQFQIGGRSVPFTIPANTTKAVFSNQASTIQLQAGTVAGTIVLTPTFATSLGGIDLTPANATPLALTVPQQAPQLLNVVLASTTASSFTLSITGFATSRSLSQMAFQFTPVATENVATTSLNLNVDSTFSAWYQGTASAAFGSNFTATVTFNLAGTLNKATSLTNTIQSVAVTLTNSQGSSATKTVALQ